MAHALGSVGALGSWEGEGGCHAQSTLPESPAPAPVVAQLWDKVWPGTSHPAVCPQPERGHRQAGKFESEPKNRLSPRAEKSPGQREGIYRQAAPQGPGHWVRPQALQLPPAHTRPPASCPAGFYVVDTSSLTPCPPGPGSWAGSVCPLGFSPLGSTSPLYRWETEAHRNNTPSLQAVGQS